MNELMAVSAGGFLGAVSRYLLGRAVSGVWRGDFPLGTFTINMLGSFALGIVVGHPYFAGHLLSGPVRSAIGVGFLGAFTTFSALMYEGFMLADRKKPGLSAFYVLGSVLTGLLLAWVGLSIF